MRAGNLDRTIFIERKTVALNDYGAPVESWTQLAMMRAQLLQNSMDDREGARGHSTDATVTFRTRWLDGVTLEDRVSYAGHAYTIRQIKELGRRAGLDLLCERVGP